MMPGSEPEQIERIIKITKKIFSTSKDIELLDTEETKYERDAKIQKRLFEKNKKIITCIPKI